MAITAASLIAPQGFIQPSLVRGMAGDAAAIAAKVAADVAQWITDGETAAAGLDITARDNASRAWAYYRWYDSLAEQYAAIPASRTLVDQGTVTMSARSAAEFKERAAHWLELYTGIVGTTDSRHLGTIATEVSVRIR